MSALDWILLGLVAAGAVAALVRVFRRKTGCCGNCGGCTASCRDRKP